jgi:hypothetical protein
MTGWPIMAGVPAASAGPGAVLHVARRRDG